MWGEGSVSKCSFSLKWRIGRSKVAGLLPPPPRGDPPKWPARDPPPITWPGEREGGKTRHFSNYSLIKGYFKKPISQNLSAKLAPSFLQCQSLPISFLQAVWRENVPYIVTQAYKSRLHYILQATSLQKAVNINNKAGHNSTRGTVSSLLFSCWQVLLHTVYIFNIFYVDWGYRFKTPIAKEAFVSNVHFNILINISL